MSAGRYVLGAALLALVVVSLALGARSLRARLLPDWSGAPARLAESVIALALLLALAQLLGTVGAMRAGWLALGCVLAGGALAALPRGAVHAEPAAVEVAPAAGRLSLAAAAAAVFAVGFQWLSRSIDVLGRGMGDPDTLWYHMPFAARFAQDGFTTRLHFAESEPITTFHPANAELLHGIGISLFGGFDLLSPFLNLGFAALCLLAGWCIGRPRGAAPASMAAVAVVLLAPVMLQTQPGEAANDTVALALFLASAALVANARRRPAALALAAVAAGLALATKLSLVVPVVALAACVTVAAPRAVRARTAGTWAAALLVFGGFWYLRNLVRVGNPLPWLDLGPLPSPPHPLTDKASFSVAHYLSDWQIVRDRFVDGLAALGDLWPLVLAAALAGGVLALWRRGPLRPLGAVALIAFAAYVVTPATAGGQEGDPALFVLNLRFLSPALALGLALLAVLAPPGSRAARLAAPALLVLALVTMAGDGIWPEHSGAVGLALAVAALALAAAVARLRPAPRTALALGAGLAVLAVAAGYPAQNRYLERRYTHAGGTIAAPSVWAQRLHDSRVGVVGYLLQYPLYGRDLSNRVEYVGVRGPHGAFGPARDCRRWRALLRGGRYRYVVTSPVASVALGPLEQLPEPREARWTASLAGASRVVRLAAPHITVFRLPARVDASGCPPGVG